MKKSIGLLMIVMAVISMAFVSCDANTAPQTDILGEIYLSNDSQSRGITVSGTNTHKVEDLYWYYKAVKNDSGLFNTGVTNGFVPVKKTEAGVAERGLENAKLGLFFSYGNWTFTLRGVDEPINGNTIDDGVVLYQGSQTIDVNKDKNFLNLTLNEGNGLTTEILFDTSEGVYFSHDNITSGMTFSLFVEDKVNGESKGTINVNEEGIHVEDGKVTFTDITYSAPEEGIAEGQHVMTFTLTQTGVADNISKVATYELVYTVSKGMTYTVSGDLTKAEVTGEVSVGSYAVSVPETTASKVIPVESADSKVVKKETTVSTLDLTVKYPEGAVLDTRTETAVSGSIVKADAKIGFELDPDSTEGIAISGISDEQELTKYTLSLNVADTNGVLIEVSKFIGKDLEIEAVYHKGNELPDDNGESYEYNSETGVLTLKVYNASPIDVVTKKALAVAKIGDEKFTTLSAAIEAAVDGDTVTLLDNVDLSSAITISKSINIDGNNKTISLSCDTANAAIKILPGNNGLIINISNLTINTNQGGIWDFGTNTTLNLTGVEIQNATYFALYHSGSYNGFTCNAVNSTFTTPENANADCTAIYISGTSKYKQKLNLTRCVVKGVTGIESKYTDMNLIDCKIESLVDEVTFVQNNNGSTADGFAVVSTDNSMSPDSPKPTAVITLDGGEYKGAIGLATIYNKNDNPEFSEASYVFKNGPTINNTSLTGKVAYCLVNNTAYDNLADAISAANNGETVTTIDVLTNVTLDNNIADGVGKSRNITFRGNGSQTVDVVTKAVSAEGGQLNYQRGSSFTFENLIIEAGEGSFDGIVCDELTFKNCTIKGKLTMYGKATFINCVFDNTMANQYSIWTWGGTDVTFEDCTFDTNGKAILLYGGSSNSNPTNLVVKGCTFNDRKSGAAGKAAIEIGNDYNSTYTLTVNGATVNGFADGLNTGSKLWANKNSMDADHLTVTIDGTQVQ